MTRELTRIGLCGLSRLIETRAVSPREVVEAYLERIARLDPPLAAFQEVTADRARAEAKAAESEILRGGRRGPLHGIPFAVKDIIDVAGMRTTAGSRLHADHVAQRDADCVAALSRAGAILLGKCATYEFATGGPSFDLPWPPTRNPWNLDRAPGGSSTGSAGAVAADLAPVALGSDTGGSIRIPAAYCGLTGIKPGFGRITTSGVRPLSPALDTIGVLARTAADGAVALEALTGQPVSDQTVSADPSLHGLKIGFSPALAGGASDEVVAAMQAAVAVFKSLGASVEPVTLAPAEDYGAAQRMIVLAEGFALHRQALAANLASYGEVFRYRVLPGALVSGADLAAAFWLQRNLTDQMLATLRQVDVLLAPTAQGGAPSFASMALNGRLRPFPTAPFSLTRVPTVALCNGFTGNGLPLSMQIAARPSDEATALRVAHAYQQATKWHEKRPPEHTTPATSRTPPWTPDPAPVDGQLAAYVDACLRLHGIGPDERQLMQLREGAGAILGMAEHVRRHVSYLAT